MKILVQLNESYRLKNFGKEYFLNYLRRSFATFEQVLLKPHFKECCLNFNSIDVDNETIELQYTGKMSTDQLYFQLKQWEYNRMMRAWTFQYDTHMA